MATTMKERIADAVTKAQVVNIDANGVMYQAKYLKDLHIVVKVHINIHDQSLLNGDICNVIGEMVSTGELIVERLEDSVRVVVRKNQVSVPEKWVRYPF